MVIREEMLEEAREEIIRERKKEESIWKKIPFSVMVIIAVVVIFAGWWMWSTGQNLRDVIVLIGLAVAFIIFISKGGEEPKMLGEQELKNALLLKLRWKQRNTDEIPDGIIRVGKETRLQHTIGVGGVSIRKRYILWYLEQTAGQEEINLAALDPYTAEIFDLVPLPEGEEAIKRNIYKDFVVIPSFDIWTEKKAGEYGGKRR